MWGQAKKSYLQLLNLQLGIPRPKQGISKQGIPKQGISAIFMVSCQLVEGLWRNSCCFETFVALLFFPT